MQQNILYKYESVKNENEKRSPKNFVYYTYIRGFKSENKFTEKELKMT